ncbi:hypothetical protein F5Y10DRAFT_290627 [Nemania abortiva]|nr:hypothetical protein F5Y10DRAFT_290627 [Nemania abortiva]
MTEIGDNQFHGPVHKICRAIDKLGDSLQPYFTVINSFVSSNPEIAGLIWGEKARRLAGEEKIKDRLVMAMTQLYTDLFELCHYICSTFSSTQGSGAKKMRNIAKILWTPFDKQFGEFKKRLAAHRKLLETAIREYTAKTVGKTYNDLGNLLQSYYALLDEQKSFNQCYREDFLVRHVEHIKSWINPPLWQSVLEDLKAKRSPLTSTWILQHSSYQWWFGESHGVIPSVSDTAQLSGNHLRSRTLMIYGKPGYGKSMLCTTVIDQLFTKTSTVDEALKPTQWDAPTAFYMFDKRRPDAQNSESAMRAVLTQLLHHSQFNSKLVDFALLLKGVEGSGQPIASASEVRILLQFFLEKIQRVTLVFDGLDECDDASEFLSQVDQITSTTFSRILLFSRPNVTFDGTWIGESRILHLADQANLEDIKTYLATGLRHLVTSEKLITDKPIETLASSLAQRSHSMFLWASIMINYLDSDFLSPQDRDDAMNEMCSFEELDQLYVSILNRLYKTCRTTKARWNSQRLFQWVYAAFRPLRVEELRFALGIKAGSETKIPQLMKRFEKALPKMTGALLEIGQDRAVRPIHTSFLEFFTQMQDTTTPLASVHLQCNFKFDANTARHLVAIDCLSYLLYDAPKERLSRLSQTHPISRVIIDRYPLLLYTTEFWVLHVTEAIRGRIMLPGQPTGDDYLADGLLGYINSFIDNKLVATVWIEASWHFGIPPSLHQLASLVNTVRIPTMPRLRELLVVFSNELKDLSSHWGRILQQDPGEIWEPSISAFMKPQSWISCDQATVTELGSSQIGAGQKNLELSHDSECILISSQSSSNGSEVGLIKVWPSRYFVDNIQSTHDPDFDKMSSEWAASYTIKRLIDGLSIHHIDVQLPEESVVSIVKMARLNDGRFEFPVAFSHDLRQITVLNYLIRIHSSSTDISRQAFSVQALDFGQTNTQEQNNIAPVPFSWYSLIFSPSSRYIAIMRGPSKPSLHSNTYKERQALVLEDRGKTWEIPEFQVLATEYLRISPHIETRFWAFHPTQPALAIACLGETNLWFFEHPARWVYLPAGAPLDNLAFSKCGSYLHGIVCGPYGGASRMICIRKYFKDRKTITSSGQDLGMEVATVHQSEQRTLSRETKTETILTSDSITFDNVEGRSQLSMLRHLNDEGSVILQKLRDDGTVQFQHLTRLPRSSSLENSYATVVSELSRSESDSIRLVINKAMEDTYSCRPKPDMSLPLLITRNAESIPRWTSKHTLALEDSPSPQRRRIT